MGSEQSASYFRYWSKVARDADGNLKSFHLLPYHCLDVAAVGYVLMQRQISWMNAITRASPLSFTELQRVLLLFLIVHDFGKFSSRSFQSHVWEVFGLLQKCSSVVPHNAHRHDALGMALWEDELFSRIWERDWFTSGVEFLDALSYLQPISQASFGHHGHAVDIDKISIEEEFTRDDIEAAADFLESCAALLVRQPSVLPEDLGEMYDALKVQSWLLSGFIILCDWIGSNESLFPHCSQPMALDDYWQQACKLAEHAIKAAGILSVPQSEFNGMGQLFHNLADVTPSPLQAYVSECDLPAGPQLWIIEDITGSGKTEAAIMLAHRLMQQGSEGIFVALPTMATANAMYDRMAKAYRSLFSADGRPSLALAHGRRNLMDGFTSTILDFEGSLPTMIPDEGSEEPTEASAACARWIADNKKKAFLAHVGVGTIDQALIAVLPAKHHTLRLLGLSNKVLIVDEVHACDAYMAELLKALLQFHAAMGGSAILLSATIPKAMRKAFANAFLKGLNSEKRATEFSGSFPSVTRIGADEPSETAVAPRSDLRRSVVVKLVHNEASILKEIVDAAVSGACVCWVRNTVADAIKAYELLKGEASVDKDRLMLFHARYAMGHRLDREKVVLSNFGKESSPDQRQGAILIATQVVEQSLDLDFDFMVSDLAPIDLLIQRAGRIHRHHREFRGNLTRAVLWVFSPPLVESPASGWFADFFQDAAHVYEAHGHLWRTARLLQSKGGWTMPDDARDLIEGVYGEEGEEIPGGLMKKQNDAEGRRRAEGAQGRFNALQVTAGYERQFGSLFADAAAPTRLGEPSVTLRLAIRSGERILPLYEHHLHAWMLSEVQVRESLVAKSRATEKEKQQAAATMRDRGKWSELIILEQARDCLWTGKASDINGNPIELVYSIDSGLKVEKGGK
ncbi:CRISPR-associated helicase/endonuclease Cas3 [Desulfomonile tiedjei]|uniref:CRISPR-associated helicase, Cas3 family n=1 Tax=Desulfomonile tiedjei (strain ATCC 49306 / DSM 6799 / DCB-1) TaxID=706587 RepID=I4CC90_DESTA|nr:CRISPR-associated helicase/endonuclease Cas3 [Desulfomonile tiedjei]AFM27181.1 CRISPR-associated helicase, Cas3 family [Desulfomonile tiedjei DSM 6799]